MHDDSAAGDVALRPGESRILAFDGMNDDAFDLLGNRQRDRTRSGAQIDDQSRGGVVGRVDRTHPERIDAPARDNLGLWSRHEDARADSQVEVTETGAAGEVLQGNPGFAPSHQFGEHGVLTGRQIAGDGQSRGWAADDEGRKHFRVMTWLGHSGSRQPTMRSFNRDPQ